ncbi:hypothetical protein ABPG75_011578 [Micractinium tetrahymenae]
MLRALAALVLACGLAVALPLERQSLALAFQATGELSVAPTAAGLEVSGLRFRGCPRRSLAVLLLDGAQPTEDMLSRPALDFDRTFDRASGTWVLGIDLPAAAPRPARLDLWCRACRTADGAQLSGQLSSQPLAGGASGTLVVLLQGATLPGRQAAPSGGASAASASQRHSLQQSAGGCSVTVGGTIHTFASCSPVSRSNSYPLTLHASVEPGAGGTGALLRMGMVASTRGGWVSFGLPQYPGAMIGADAVVLYPTATGAEVAGFKLTSTLESIVNKAKGSFPLSDAAAEASGGELRAVFTISLPNESVASATAASGVNYIYALGPMGDLTAPGLSYHSYDFGSGSFVMKAAVAAASPPPAATAAAPPSIPTPAAATPASEEAHGSDHEHHHGEEHDDHDDDHHASGSGSGSPSSSSGSAAGAASAAAACELRLGVNAAPTAFSGCRLLGGVGSGFWLMWRAAPSATSPSKTTVTMALNTSSTSGYVAVGFPTQAGRMIGSSAMILAACSSGADCSGGARLSQFYLKGEIESAVVPDTRMAVTNIQAAALPTGLAGSFDFEVESAAAGRRLLLLQEGLNLPLIFAAGPATAEGSPLMHDNEGSGSVPALDTSSTGAATVDAGSSDDSVMKAASAHGWLAAIGWGVLVPSGIVMARSFKDARPPLWFHLHRAIQALGFVLGTVALGLGFALVGGWHAETDKLAVHRNLGVACTALGATQFTALVIRPAKGQKYRLAWELWHAWVGRGAAVVAIANIYWGILYAYSELGAWAWASYTAVLAVIVAISVVKDTSDFLRRRRQRAHGAVQLRKPASLAPPRSPAPAGADSADVEAPSLSAKPSSTALKQGTTPGGSSISSLNGLPQ